MHCDDIQDRSRTHLLDLDGHRRLQIAAVFNLTLPGEHPYCGDGLVSSGFPYDPEKDFMAERSEFLASMNWSLQLNCAD